MVLLIRASLGALALLAASVLAWSAPAMAARVALMIIDLEPIGRGTVGRIEMASDSTRDVAYEVLMMRGEISDDGQLSLIPADEDFLVFPTQVILKANSRQVFRVQYVGEAELSESQIYYMSIRQIPVSFEEVETSQVQVVVNFNVLVNVVPKGAEAVPTVLSINAATRDLPAPSAATPQAPTPTVEAAEDTTPEADDASSEAAPTPSSQQAPPPTQPVSGLEVRVGNDGNRYYLAGLSIWKIKGKTVDGESFDGEFAADKIARAIGAGVVGPGRERIFFLPLAVELDPATVSIEIEVPDEDG